MEVKVKMQPTPNPKAMKFIINHDVISDGKVSFNDASECEQMPLASGLLYLANVTQVHLFENVITVTQNGASDWEMLGGAVESIIGVEMPAHNPRFEVVNKRNKKIDLSNLPPEIAKVEEILERTIRPGLRADGGDLEVVELADDVLTIRYEGACGGCPSAQLGTLEAIKNILRNEYKPEIEVVTVD
jgi:NFU1 iron-sulfur cluster scaffold homolog, mitochondrial